MSSPFDGTQLCAQIDPEIFFPEERKHWKENIAEAKALCAKCPLLSACDTYATGTVGLYGVWGGKWRDGSGFTSQAIMNKEVA